MVIIETAVLKTINVLQDDQTSVFQLVKIEVVQKDHASVLTVSLVLWGENNWLKPTY